MALHLTGKAQQAYTAMEGELTVNHGEVKAVMLCWYNIMRRQIRPPNVLFNTERYCTVLCWPCNEIKGLTSGCGSMRREKVMKKLWWNNSYKFCHQLLRCL